MHETLDPSANSGQSTPSGAEAAQPEPELSDLELKALARKVYALIKAELRIGRERSGRDL